MSDTPRLVIFVHGWSVSNTDTYGEFPDRLQTEAEAHGLELDIHQIWLGKYVSFRDEVRLEDISRAFQTELNAKVGALLADGRRFICITHSTGGPVIRDWLDRYHIGVDKLDCPLSHLIMLAPANFGSALAQLGKSRVGRLKAWFDDVEPGSGVLDWLALGSSDAWELNRAWFDYPDLTGLDRPIFPFVLTGQSIDHKLYDHVNSYTGESGSDGVVRLAAANLNATFVRLVQEEPGLLPDTDPPEYQAPSLKVETLARRENIAFRIIEGRSHSGKKMGIIRSIKNDNLPHPTVTEVLRCIGVENSIDYNNLCKTFAQENIQIMDQERIAKHFLPGHYFITDPHSMVIFHLVDDHGYPLDAFDLILTGKDNDPNLLPPGFLKDRQRNQKHLGTVTLFFNHALMTGCPALMDNNHIVRPARPDSQELGVRVQPHVTDGLVHYLNAILEASTEQLKNFLRPNETTMVEIVLRRVVHEGVFRLSQDRTPTSFKHDPEGPVIE